jgi:hypothetical protein
MGKTRREWLKGTLGVGAFITVAPRSVLLAKSQPQQMRNLALNRAAYASSSADFINTGHMATDGEMTTQWTSKDADSQWIYVDLGDLCEVRKVVLRWGKNYAKVYKIQVSSDRGPSPTTGFVETWSDVYETRSGRGEVEDIALSPGKARYVRLLCSERALPGGYSLCGFEVYGTGGPRIRPTPIPPLRQDGTLELSGGWKLVSESFISDGAGKISTCGYDDSEWLVATVPGTVLTSYLNVGAVPDMFYSDHQYQVSDWFAHCRWWYRNEVLVPASYKGKRVWLNLDGINYKADIYVNGSLVGKMAGAFIRGGFDITDKVIPGKKNCIAVLIYPVTNPCDVTVRTLEDYDWPEEFTRNSPTFLESAGWDWLATIRDRNIGIWNRVSLSPSGDVTIIDPFLITDLPLLPDLSQADLTLKLELQNHSDQQRSGILKVSLGEARFAHSFSLQGGEIRSLSLDKSTHPELSLHQPRLWWPNGYGEQNLYDLSLRVELEGSGTSDAKDTKVGIRKLTYNQDFLFDRDVSKVVDANEILYGNSGPKTLPFIPSAKPLTISCNGQRIMLKGADWGMDEGMLRCDQEGYETRLRMEKDMNFTLIRNCLGNVAKQEFYDACNRYGVLIWEEFGLNHSNLPYDIELWLTNVRARIRAKRNHACVALWCISNEGFTQEPVRSEVPKLVDALDGTRLLLQTSTQYPPTNGDASAGTSSPLFYFMEAAHGFRPEMYSPAVPPIESMRRMMPHNKLWPIGQMWAVHDWWRAKIGGGVCASTEKAIAAYGAATGIEDFCLKAQMVNMEVYKAIYEAWNDKLWDDCTGVMVWMSNPCWPSLVWNTYDYYFEPTAAYFGCKKACEPIHIQWSMASNNVKVVNLTSKPLHGLSAEARVYNLDGSLQLKKSTRLDCPSDNVQQCFNLFEGADPQAASLSDIHFIRLELKDAEGHPLSDNFYWNAKEVWKYEGLSAMNEVQVSGRVKSGQDGEACKLTINVENPSKVVALMTRLKLVDPASGLLVAPILYSENYFSLTPGESRLITIEFRTKKVVGNEVKVMIEGWNVKPAELGRVRTLQYGRDS